MDHQITSSHLTPVHLFSVTVYSYQGNEGLELVHLTGIILKTSVLTYSREGSKLDELC